MERSIATARRRLPVEGALKAGLLAGASVLAMIAAGPAPAQVAADERIYRAEALAHANAVETAWRRLETHILEESTGPTAWTGAVPPASAGWQSGWTSRGLEARYCDDTLLVYLAPGALKGVGADHRAVHAAPLAYGDGRDPALHWLEGGVAEGGAGRGSVTLPACLSDAALGGPLPAGRAALAGAVRDPFLHTTERVTRERREEPCAGGMHGDGRTLIREVTQEYNGRDNAVGAPVLGAWEVLIDGCRADYSQWEHYTLPCHWDAGPPHNRRMEGREVWRRLKTVTADGETLGTPEFVSTSCWTGDALPPAPVPEISEESRKETRSGSCPAGYVGSLSYRRTVTLRSTRFPWDEAPVTQTVRGPWVLESDDCVEEVEPDLDDETGTGEPGVDECGDCDPSQPGNICGTVGVGEDGGDDDGGDCFLTTAVVQHRGEADDGPTLTALRAFRDGYMSRSAERRALVAEYYAIAPAIVAAIPADDPEWDRIAAEIDAAVACIAEGGEDRAFGIYADMVRRLKAAWLEDGGAALARDGSAP